MKTSMGYTPRRSAATVGSPRIGTPCGPTVHRTLRGGIDNPEAASGRRWRSTNLTSKRDGIESHRSEVILPIPQPGSDDIDRVAE
jgi:hypothetical protein